MNENIEYLNLLPTPLDKQQLAACCANDNAVVAAGAGSGKTQVLATRFAYLVMTKNIQADRILTLTFTKKAASEMYERIFSVLDFFSENEKTPPIEKARAKSALEIFGRAHIQTLDSYCASILRQCANRYGIRADFSQESFEELAETLALPFILRRRNEDAVHDFVNFSNCGDLQAISKEFAKEVVLRSSLAFADDYFTDFLQKKADGARKFWSAEHKNLLSEINDFENVFCDLEKVSASSLELKNEIEKLKQILLFFGNCAINFSPEKFAQIFKELSALKFALPRDKASEPIKEIAKNIRGDENPSAPFLRLCECADFMKDLPMWMRRAKMQNDFLRELNSKKRISGKLSFRDVSAMALKALMDFSDIRFQEQNAYDKIMIDEFQDNNKMNRDLLFLISCKNDASAEECLSGKKIVAGKLFFVGDEKQSIYKFRDADVSVFKTLSKDLGVAPIPMVYNYRSTQEMLNSFNQIFGGFFPDGSEICDEKKYIFPRKAKNNFEAEFSEKTIAKKNPQLPCEKNPYKNPSLHVCMYNQNALDSEEEFLEKIYKKINEEKLRGKLLSFEEAKKIVFMDAKDQSAIFIAQEIKRRILWSEKLATEGKLKKPLSFGDFAVLDKGRGDRDYFSKHFLSQGVPFNMDLQSDIFSEGPANDIYYFLRLCVYPSDTFALAIFLRSPFANISAESAQNIIADSKKITCEERAQYKVAMDFYEKMRKQVLRLPLSKTISELWNEWGYRYETLWNKNLFLFAESYDILFELARMADEKGLSVADFVESLEAIKEGRAEEKLDINYPKESSDAVQIMTIHKSKGLQFPIVFVYGCTAGFKKERDERDEKQTENSPFGEGRLIDDAKSEAEFRRIFYVALTRAKKEAYVVGTWRNGKDFIFQNIIKKYYPNAQEFLATGTALFLEGVPFDFVSIKPTERAGILKFAPGEKEKNAFALRLESAMQKAFVLKTEHPKKSVIFPSALELPAEKCPPPKIHLPSLYPNLTLLLKKLENMNFFANDFGILAHAFLESFVKKNESIIKNPELYKTLYDYDLSFEENLQKKPIKEIAEICFAMVRHFEKDFGADLHLAQKIMAETQFVFAHTEGIVNGVIDLAYKMPSGEVVVVDYKTDEEIIPARYAAQIACYKAATAALFCTEEKKVLCNLYYLRYAKKIAVD